MKGIELSKLIWEWIGKNNIHPDDLDIMFIGEFLDELEKDNG